MSDESQFGKSHSWWYMWTLIAWAVTYYFQGWLRDENNHFNNLLQCKVKRSSIKFCDCVNSAWLHVWSSSSFASNNKKLGLKPIKKCYCISLWTCCCIVWKFYCLADETVFAASMQFVSAKTPITDKFTTDTRTHWINLVSRVATLDRLLYSNDQDNPN